MSITIAPKQFKFTGNEIKEFHLGRQCLNIMEKYSQKAQFINFSDETFETNGSVRLKSVRLGQDLTSRGVVFGDVIMLCSSNNNDVCIPFLAGLYLGAPILSIPENTTTLELSHFMKIGLPRLVFCTYDQADRIKVVVNDMQLNTEIVVFGAPADTEYLLFEELLKSTGNEEEFKVTEFDPASTSAIIVLSSGSMGYPKGICLTHEQIAYVVGLPTHAADPDEVSKESILYFSSLFWISGSMTVLMSLLLGQTRIQSTLPFSPDWVYRAAEKYKPSIVIFGESAAADFMKHPEVGKDSFDMPYVKVCLILGSLMNVNAKKAFKKKIPNGNISNGYGMTEVAGPLTTVPPGCTKDATVGKVLPWIEWKLICAESGEEVKGFHQKGELLVKGPTVFKNYYRNPEETKNAFSDGYYKTGDLLYRDEEDYFYFVDRAKQMFKYRSYQISPVELEQVIRSACHVEHVCVVGVEAGEVGQHPLAFVQKTEGSSITAQDIKDAVKNNLSDYKYLRGGVVFLESMPLTHNGKVDRKHLNAIKATCNPE